jgi:hypothetical protein
MPMSYLSPPFELDPVKVTGRHLPLEGGGWVGVSGATMIGSIL